MIAKTPAELTALAVVAGVAACVFAWLGLLWVTGYMTIVAALGVAMAWVLSR